MSESILAFFQQLVNGLTIGSLYALIAIGYTMVYGIIGMINFAHGEIYMIGSYIAIIVLSALLAMGVASVPIILLIALLVSVIVAGSFGWSVERLAYRPLRGRHRLVPLISAIGMSIFLQNYVAISQGNRDLPLQPLLQGGWQIGAEGGFQVYLSYVQVLVFVVSLVAMAALTWLINKTRYGRACRACSQDVGMVRLLGINADNVIATTFVVGASLAAVAGLMYALLIGLSNPWVGFVAGIKAFTAAVLGGIGSIPGAMLGGFILGITESFASAYISTEYKDVVAFSLLVIILLFKPTGILGKPEVEKV